MSQAALDAAKFAKMLYQRGLALSQRGPADDFFNATSGAESFSGGTGNDTVSYFASTSGVSAQISPQHATGCATPTSSADRMLLHPRPHGVKSAEALIAAG